MSRISEWYWSARHRVEKRDAINQTLKRQHKTQAEIKARRAAKYREIDAQMKELRRPADNPPWEKE
jgi:hypothetical protein